MLGGWPEYMGGYIWWCWWGAADIVDAPDMTLWWSDMEMDEAPGTEACGARCLSMTSSYSGWTPPSAARTWIPKGRSPGVSVGGGGGEAWGPSGDVEVCPGGP